SRTPFEAASRPADDMTAQEMIDDRCRQNFLGVDFARGDAIRSQPGRDNRIALFLSPVNMVHHEASRLSQDRMLCPERRAEGPSAVARRGLNIEISKRAFAGDPAVGGGVQRHSAREAKGFKSRFL